jgi:hypothetical protein
LKNSRLVVFIFKLDSVFSLTAVGIIVHVRRHAGSLRGKHFKKIISNPRSRIQNA